MKKFNNPQMEVVRFASEDVIATSGPIFVNGLSHHLYVERYGTYSMKGTQFSPENGDLPASPDNPFKVINFGGWNPAPYNGVTGTGWWAYDGEKWVPCTDPVHQSSFNTLSKTN